MKNLLSASLIVSVVCLFINSTSEAQKLPGVQKASVFAPAEIKIDGKATEWNNTFQAANNATLMHYTLANDDKSLYLALQITDLLTIKKIMSGGLRLSIKGAAKNDQSIVIAGMLVPAKGRVTPDKNLKEDAEDIDKILGRYNDQLATNMKEIGVLGIKDIPDTLISAYNEYGIKQAARFDNKMAITYELAVPLNYIGRLLNGGAFKYNISLPGASDDVFSALINKPQTSPANAATTSTFMVSITINGVDANVVYSPTDFSGTYTLAKKQ